MDYDLDNDDEDWLVAYNARWAGGGGSGSTASALSTNGAASLSSPSLQLSDHKLERILWRLDVSCAEANERAIASGGCCVCKIFQVLF